jgi:beta-lysine 5,6-aminomutase alpha subunit
VGEKLGLDKKVIDECRVFAEKIADELMGFIGGHTTDSVERAVTRLLGVDGRDRIGTPYPNVLVDAVKGASGLASGVAHACADLIAHTGETLTDAARAIAEKKLKLADVPRLPAEKRRRIIAGLADAGLDRIGRRAAQREELRQKYPMSPPPLLYVIVATGNIHEDVAQAKSAVTNGADCIAVIRSTAQSLLDYVPYGATTEGFGGTYATQENFRIMREALDGMMPDEGRYVNLVNYASGLCMPEIAVAAAFERLDMLLNDSMYGIIFRNINTYRTFVDQYFSRMINAKADIIINTGEDNYLTTADAVEKAHTVLASDFINESFAARSGLPPRLMGLGHAFEIDPAIEGSFLMELAQAQMIREIFPDAPIKYMPPTKHVTGNVFQTHLIDMMFNVSSVMTNQSIHLLGILTEAIHTPFVGDRYLALSGARYAKRALMGIEAEISFAEGGFIRRRAAEVLRNAHGMLAEIADIGLVEALSRGMFADIHRDPKGGKGADGVVTKDDDYYNPFLEVRP